MSGLGRCHPCIRCGRGGGEWEEERRGDREEPVIESAERLPHGALCHTHCLTELFPQLPGEADTIMPGWREWRGQVTCPRPPSK